MKNIILTGGSSTIGKKIILSNKTKRLNFISQINKGSKIIKKNVKYINSNFLKTSEINKFSKKLIKNKNIYDALIHTPSGKLEIKRFFEYNWNKIKAQIDIQVKSLVLIMNDLIKHDKISSGFKLIIISSYLSKKNKYSKGFTSYYLAKVLLEGYAEILSKEITTKKIKVYLIRPKFFDSPLHSNLPSFYVEKNSKKEKNELDKNIKKIIDLLNKWKYQQINRYSF